MAPEPDRNLVIWDGHFHAFSHRGVNETSSAALRVGFADIEFDHLDEYKDIPGMYDKMMPKCERIGAWLATGLTIDDIKEIYKRHPDLIKGFGELKLYDEYAGKPLNYKRISFAHEVCRFSEECGYLPVYIHYELNEPVNVRAFDKLLRDHPDVPIVLCHCGISEKNTEFAFNAAKKLAYDHGNCWLDVSWDAAAYLSKNPLLLTQLPVDRVFWGSDFNNRALTYKKPRYNKSDIANQLSTIKKYIDSDRNIRNLFGR